MIDETFLADLRLSAAPEQAWRLSEPVAVNRLGDGTVLTASLGAALWAGSLVMAPARPADAAAWEVRIARLQRPGTCFLAWDPRRAGPRADPDGAILGSSTPTIHTLHADNQRLRITGLPPGYVISPGDCIGWQYGSSPVRRAVHQAVTGAMADGAGLTPLFEVTPHIRPGVTTGTAVTLIRPALYARLTGADYGRGGRLITQGGRIDFIQTVRP